MGPDHGDRIRPDVPRAPHQRSAVVYWPGVVLVDAVVLCQTVIAPLMILFLNGIGFVALTVDAKTFVVVRLLDRVSEFRFEIVEMFRVPMLARVAARFVVETAFDTTRFPNGCVTAEDWIFEKVLAKTRDDGIGPNRFEEFRFEI